MEQKKFIKFGLTQSALESHVQIIEKEVRDYIQTSSHFKGTGGAGGTKGLVDVSAAMAEITIFTAGRALQGEEVRSKLTTEFADLYHDLDKGFSPINFMLPWAPLPHNRKRDKAHARMRDIYMEIINKRRENENGNSNAENASDMITNLMHCVYKDGTAVPDKEIACMMITLLMAGQHSSASIGSWILLRLASQPEITEELYQEQLANLPRQQLDPLNLHYSDLALLPLHQNVIKETLRLHSSIHSLMRKVKTPLPVPGAELVIPESHVLLASPGVTALSEEYFPNPTHWDPRRWAAADQSQNDLKENAKEDDTVDYGYGAVSKGTSSPYLPFGAGRHRCIGEKFAYVNLGVILAVLVREFRFFTVDGGREVPGTDYSSLFSGPLQPTLVRWERRDSGVLKGE